MMQRTKRRERSSLLSCRHLVARCSQSLYYATAPIVIAAITSVEVDHAFSALIRKFSCAHLRARLHKGSTFSRRSCKLKLAHLYKY